MGGSIKVPVSHWDVPMMISFVRAVGGCVTKVWQILEAAEVAETNVNLVDWEHPSLRKTSLNYSERAFVYPLPSFYRALKLRFLLDVKSHHVAVCRCRPKGEIRFLLESRGALHKLPRSSDLLWPWEVLYRILVEGAASKTLAKRLSL